MHGKKCHPPSKISIKYTHTKLMLFTPSLIASLIPWPETNKIQKKRTLRKKRIHSKTSLKGYLTLKDKKMKLASFICKKIFIISISMELSMLVHSTPDSKEPKGNSINLDSIVCYSIILKSIPTFNCLSQARESIKIMKWKIKWMWE